MDIKQSLSTSGVAKILGISRIAVFKKIKKGQIKAIKVGKTYVINPQDIGLSTQISLTAHDKSEIEHAVKRTVREYGETLRLLGQE